ncbi:Hypothetical protein TGAM_1062 [Thermococcus gammatolerans EJ3]|uniref:Uncharacterized protein n=2 Tax=Thermococcus TaxID=2263 RepID=C5A5Q2_THEGJ|nr:Hypothetical protein TGAM_1062 [Thermococcus gammatolerans EJ3]
MLSMKKVQILAALLVFALFSGVVAIQFKGGSGKKAMTEDMPSTGTNPKDSTPIETEKPEVPSCTLISNTSFEPINGVVGWWIKDGTGRTAYGKDIEITPKVNLSEMKSYGKSLWVDWPAELGIKPPCPLVGDAFISVSEAEVDADFKPPCHSLKRSAKLPPGKVYLASYVVPVKNSSWTVYENIPIGNGTNFLKTGGIQGGRVTNLTAVCSCGSEGLIEALKASIKAAGFEEVPSGGHRGKTTASSR